MAGGQLRFGDTAASKQASFQFGIVVALTGMRQPPLMGDFSLHMCGFQEVYHQFKRDLDRLSIEIDRRNKLRKQPFQSFSPRFLEISVSI